MSDICVLNQNDELKNRHLELISAEFQQSSFMQKKQMPQHCAAVA